MMLMFLEDMDRWFVLLVFDFGEWVSFVKVL